MIVDRLENISMYRIVPDHVVDFIKTLKNDVALGKVELLDKDYVNIEEYTTKPIEDAKFEAHNNYIDIQLLLEGEERIYNNPVCKMTDISTPYNPENDIIFYGDEVKGSDFITLNGGNFMMIFPHEAHAPQVCVATPQKVKKVVVKVKV